jgi:curved DNA-binding protein CbpA
MDPYYILNVNQNASEDEIKQRFYKLTQLYHPDKGGNAEIYIKYKEAYQTILKNLKNGIFKDRVKSYNEICTERARPLVLAAPPAPKDFQRQFQEAEIYNDTGYTYNLARFEKQNTDRNEKAFQAEYKTVTEKIKKVAPLFGKGQSFNSRDFNDTFTLRKKEHLKQNQALEEVYPEPEPMFLDSHYANNSASLENPQHIYGKDKYLGYEQAYCQHENPMHDDSIIEEAKPVKIGKPVRKAKMNQEEIKNELAEMRRIIEKQQEIILSLVNKK